jgi:hypothetical protein
MQLNDLDVETTVANGSFQKNPGRKRNMFNCKLGVGVLILALTQVSTLFAQTECELLLRPSVTGSPKLTESDVSRVISSLSPRLVPEMALLSDEQLEKIKAIRQEFGSLEEYVPEDDIEAHIAAVNRGAKLRNAAAPFVIAEFEKVLGDLWPAVVFDANRRLARGYGDPTGFGLPTVISGLKLNDEQQKQFENFKQEAEQHQKRLKSELTETLTSLLGKHFEAVKSELDTIQQTRFLQWFGELNLFGSLAYSDQFRDMIQQMQQDRSGDVVMEPRIYSENGERVEAPAVRNDFEIDSLHYRVLTMKELERALTLSPEQANQIKNQIHGNDVRLIVKNRRTERMKTILEDKWELPEWLDKILLPHQKSWMQQFEFQVYNLPYADSFGLMHPEVADALKLTAGQQKRISELALNYRTKVADHSRKTESAIAQAEKERQVKKFKLLTLEQIHQYRLWFGDVPID